MSLAPNELFDENDQVQSIRVQPYPNGLHNRTFANVGAAPEYAIGTPVYCDAATGFRKVWTNGETIVGFVFPAAVQTHATGEVQGVVLERGRIHYADIVLPAGESQPNLDAALKAGPREMGLDIEGLPGSGQDLDVDTDT
jgi:hypothetical protein